MFVVKGTVNHHILLQNLYLYGIRGLPHTLLKDYLTNRVQSVRLGNVISNSKIVGTGVPQGSVLGPFFFYFILINNLASHVQPAVQCLVCWRYNLVCLCLWLWLPWWCFYLCTGESFRVDQGQLLVIEC